MDEDMQYVKLDTPLYTRKTILESAVDATILLKRWESYKRIREKKLIYIKRLRLLMGRLHREISAFRRHFPDIKESRPPIPREPKPYIKKELIVQKETSYLDKEIDQIKAKLEKLSSSGI